MADKRKTMTLKPRKGGRTERPAPEKPKQVKEANTDGKAG
ncbi:hypothetical protein GCM10008940_06300 [Microbulbifer agarilyticus]